MRHYVAKAKIALRAAVLIIATAALLMSAQQSQAQSNPGLPCGDKSRGLPDYYVSAVLAQITPPNWEHSLIRIIVGGETKVALWTDGEKFELGINTLAIRESNLNDFLLNLDQSCRLPADPADAAVLAGVKWESTELSPAQFARLHHDLITALSKYVASAQGRYSRTMATKVTALYLDASSYTIKYDNGYEHIEADVFNDPKEQRAMLDWIHQLEKLAESTFHRSIWKLGSR